MRSNISISIGQFINFVLLDNNMAGTSQKYTLESTQSVDAGSWEKCLKIERIDTNQNAYVSGISMTTSFRGDTQNPILLRVSHNDPPEADDFIQSTAVLTGGKVWLPIKRRLNDANSHLFVHVFQGSGQTRDVLFMNTIYGRMLKNTVYAT